MDTTILIIRIFLFHEKENRITEKNTDLKEQKLVANV